MLKLSLRARLLAGMGLVVLTLVVVALIITTTTRNHLIAQVDDRLAVAGGPRFPGPPRGGGDPGGDGAVRPSDFYVGSFNSDGVLTTNAGSDFAGEATPDVSLAQATASADAGSRPFTVDAKEDGGPRYRVVARRSGDGQIGIIAQPLTDVDDTVNRLLLVEVLATVDHRRRARLRDVVGRAPRDPPDQADDGDRRAHRRR